MANINVLSNLQMKSSVMNMHNYTDINSVEKEVGNLAWIDGVPSIYTTIEGSDPFWFPLGVKRTIYKHVQIESSVKWVVNHNLSTQDLIYGVYDDANNLIEAQINFVSVDQIELLFTEAVSGKAILFGNSELWAASV